MPTPTDEVLTPQAVAVQAARCALRTLRLLAAGRLHLHHARVGRWVTVPDGRVYRVFRESSCDQPEVEGSVVLAVWFRLAAIPPGAALRRWLFERLCIVNTLFFAGMDGYLTKLWMVDPATSDYAGLYAWSTAESAARYGRYITAIIGPFAVPGSLGFRVSANLALEEYLARAA